MRFRMYLCVLLFFLLSGVGIVKAQEPVNTLNVSVSAKSEGQKYDQFWSRCVGAGRANEGLRASWLEQLKICKDSCGFQYCRFHGLFHDDMFVYNEVGGKPSYNWQYIDDLFDRMLKIGVKPFVELSFTPKAMVSGVRTQFWWKGNVSPPKDYKKWSDLVREFTKHCVERYGLTEVKTWYFEVWNEPNLRAFWDASKSEYFNLYKCTAFAVKSVNKDLRVGGPATSNFVPDERFSGEVEDKSKSKTHSVKDLNTLEWRGVWIIDFLDFCEKENTPVDFISTHPYPTDWALDPETGRSGGRVREVGSTRKDMLWLKKTLKESAFPNAEIHLTEWSSSPSPRDDTHDNLPAAAYIIKTNLDCIGLVNSLAYWTFTDVFEESGAGNTAFHGGFGLINYQGIVKPTFQAYRMLNQLGDEIISQKDGMIVTRDSKSGKIIALVYHYPQEMKDAPAGDPSILLKTGTPRQFSLNITGLASDAVFETMTLDNEHGCAITLWQKMGKPASIEVEQAEKLRKESMTLMIESLTVKNNELKWEKNILPWTCILIKQK